MLARVPRLAHVARAAAAGSWKARRAVSTQSDFAATAARQMLMFDEDSDMLTDFEDPRAPPNPVPIPPTHEYRETNKRVEVAPGVSVQVPTYTPDHAVARPDEVPLPFRPLFRECLFCRDPRRERDLHMLNPGMANFMHDRTWRILPRKWSHLCRKHQRRVARTIKRARHFAVLPFTDEHRASEEKLPQWAKERLGMYAFPGFTRRSELGMRSSALDAARFLATGDSDETSVADTNDATLWDLEEHTMSDGQVVSTEQESEAMEAGLEDSGEQPRV